MCRLDLTLMEGCGHVVVARASCSSDPFCSLLEKNTASPGICPNCEQDISFTPSTESCQRSRDRFAAEHERQNFGEAVLKEHLLCSIHPDSISPDEVNEIVQTHATAVNCIKDRRNDKMDGIECWNLPGRDPQLSDINRALVLRAALFRIPDSTLRQWTQAHLKNFLDTLTVDIEARKRALVRDESRLERLSQEQADILARDPMSRTIDPNGMLADSVENLHETSGQVRQEVAQGLEEISAHNHGQQVLGHEGSDEELQRRSKRAAVQQKLEKQIQHREEEQVQNFPLLEEGLSQWSNVMRSYAQLAQQDRRIRLEQLEARLRDDKQTLDHVTSRLEWDSIDLCRHQQILDELNEEWGKIITFNILARPEERNGNLEEAQGRLIKAQRLTRDRIQQAVTQGEKNAEQLLRDVEQGHIDIEKAKAALNINENQEIVPEELAPWTNLDGLTVVPDGGVQESDAHSTSSWTLTGLD